MRYTVGEMAKQPSVTASALRYYDKEGYYPSGRKLGGFPRYGNRYCAAAAGAW